MADFDTLQTSIREARAEAQAAQRSVVTKNERARSQEVELRQVSRRQPEGSDARRRAEAQREHAAAEVAEARKKRDGQRANYEKLVEAFLPFSDPRQNVERLPDTTPFLLFPVRLETRFKTLPLRGGGLQHELWVRIFPDQCSIDTFDDLLSTSEVARARSYWASVWAAGTAATPELSDLVRDQQLGAWRKLMGSFNAGRAYWILSQLRPSNPEELPVRTSEADVLPIIVTEGPAPAAKDALASYWQAVILAGGLPAEVTLALAALRAATGLGEAEAQALADTYVPAGIADLLAAGPAAGPVKVTFLSFEVSVDTKQNAWAHSAKVRTFPERFVLLGYQDSLAEPVVSALGAAIPNPLIVGPSAEDDVEALLAEALGPDVLASLSDEEKAARYVQYLTQQSDTKWMFDFDRAIEAGLGFRVNLTPEQYRTGLSRLFVLGLQLSSDAAGGKAALEDLLLHHQFGDAGFSILRQGTPSNNTEEGPAGFSMHEDPEEAHTRYFGPANPELALNPDLDGARLARALGIDPGRSALTTAENWAYTDQLEARAMQTALWHGTFGFYLESMLPSLADEPTRGELRDHFLSHVRGRGTVPSVRVGKQPYGILTVTNLRNFRWLEQSKLPPRLSRRGHSLLGTIYRACMMARDDLREKIAQAYHVGGGGDAHRTLLKVLGLHPTSVEYDRRLAEGYLALANDLLLRGFPARDVDLLRSDDRQTGIELLQRLGFTLPLDGSAPVFPLFEHPFFQQQEDVKKPPVDDGPLSEERPLGPCAQGDKNYIEWLLDKARTDHAAIRNKTGFIAGKTPSAILFDLLWYSLHLEFGEAGLRSLNAAQLLDVGEADSLRIDRDFIGIQSGRTLVESKWDILYRQEPKVAAGKTVAAHLSGLLASKSSDPSVARLSEVLSALERLAPLPTARLERCLAEHVDTCHYRLDAWLLSIISAQLDALRAGQRDDSGVRGGIYLGAYGWVENLKPKAKLLEPVELDQAQKKIFDPEGQGGVVRDSANAGHVHAPSLAHGLTAATLRNAYISAASPSDADRYKINLSSERVRWALGIIEGMQQGQGLAELLGYQLERGLHDNTSLNLDLFIYELRKVFPLVSGKLASTSIKKGRAPKNSLEQVRFAEEEAELAGDRSVTKVEARNVVNGLVLLERVATPATASYPFGFPTGTGPGQLRSASAAERAAIDAEVERLKNIRDAVADLALAESVHQTVQGNYERAAGVLDAFSKGAFPQLPDVIQSPASGRGLTHRFAVHFPAGVAPGLGLTPRSQAEPALNAWLKDLLPPPASLECAVRFRPRPDAASPPGPWSSFPVSLGALGLEPIDLLYLHDAESEKNLSALDDHVLRVFRSAAGRRLDLEIQIDYLSAGAGKVSFFQLAALLGPLRALALAARPLEASDLSLQNEGRKAQNSSARIAPARIQTAKSTLDTALAQLLADVVTPLSVLVDPSDPSVGSAHVPEVLAGIDAILAAFLSRVGPLSLFGLSGAGTGFVSERLRGVRTQLCDLVRTRSERWADRSERYHVIVEEELPAAATEEAKIALWHEAETQVRTTFTTAFADAAALGVIVAGERAFFEAKRTAAATFLGQGFTELAALFAAAGALLAGTEAFDLEPLAVDEARRGVVILAEDLLRQASELHARASANASDVGALLLAAPTAPRAGLDELNRAAQILFGEGFRIFPEFSLPSQAALEVSQCLAGQTQLLQYQTDQGTDDPTEDWLYGVARVREKLAAFETCAILSEGFVPRPPLQLTPIQLPYRDGDSWLALAYPPEHVLEGDNLLYTTFAPGFDPTQPLVGALVDEWTETIVARQETTALTFHYDRPNCEAPQSLLLVTPAAATGHWQWSDLVASLHETLDLARLRALEPDLIDDHPFARLAPATVASLSAHPVTMAVNFAAQALAKVEV